MSTDYMATCIVVDESAYKWLHDLYRFRVYNNKHIYDPKANDIIGKKLQTKLSTIPIYVLSKRWIKQELYRTGSPTLKDIINNNVQLIDLLPDYDKYVEERTKEALKYWKNVTPNRANEGVLDEFDEID